jgi:predicted transcriptional regulator
MRIELLESGLGTYDAQAGFTKLTPDGEAWSGLSGLYVSKELYNSIQDLQPLSTINEDFYKAWVAFAAFTKLGKTAFSPITTMRNFISGSILGLNAGFFFASDPKKIKDAMSMAWGTKKSRKELKSETDKLYKLGILGDGAISQEVMETINDFTNDLERISNQGAGKRVFNAIKKVYALGDDFYKVIGYYTYKGRYEKSGMPSLEAEAKAAQRMVDTFPTYSMLPKNIQRLRRFPLIGTFVSFPWESVRTSANTFRYMQEDVKAGRTSMFAKQAAGFLIANASHLALAELSKNMMGFDDDDDDKVRDMLPFYQTNSKLIYLGKDKFGQPIFMDATALFPAEVYLKPLRTLLDDREGRDIQDNINEALKETLSPYLGFDISFKTMNELFFNRDVFDREIYEGENLIDGIFNDPDKVGQHYMKNAGPGFYGNITEFARANDVQPSFFGDKFTSYGKEYKNSDALMGLLGFRFTTLNYIAGTTSLGYRNKDKFDRKKDDITNAFKSTSRLDDSGMKESIEEYSKANKELSESMIIAVKGARKLGVNEADIFRALKQSAFSTEDVEFIMAGIQTPLKKITDISAISKLEKIDLNYRDKESKRKIKLNYLYNVTDFNVLVKQKNKETYKLMDKMKKDK